MQAKTTIVSIKSLLSDWRSAKEMSVPEAVAESDHPNKIRNTKAFLILIYPYLFTCVYHDSGHGYRAMKNETFLIHSPS